MGRNRSQSKRGIPPNGPTHEQIVKLREAMGITPQVAADLLAISPASIQGFESPPKDEVGAPNPAYKPMPVGLWELMLIKAKLIYGVKLDHKIEDYFISTYQGKI